MWDYLLSDEGVLLASWLQTIGTLSAVVVSLFVTFFTLRHHSRIEGQKQQDARLQNMARASLFLANVQHEIARLKDAVANNDGQMPLLALNSSQTSIQEDYKAIRELMMSDLPNANVLVVMAMSSEVMQMLQHWFAEWIEGRRTDQFPAVMHRSVSLVGKYAELLDDFQVAYSKDTSAQLVLPKKADIEAQQRLFEGR